MKKGMLPLLLAQALLSGCATSRPNAEDPLPEGVVPFREGMTAPRLLAGTPGLTFSREAVEARVEGMMTLRCVISDDGQGRDCRVHESLPHMEEAVLLGMYQQRYAPATLDGKPVSVAYTFQFRLKTPNGPKEQYPSVAAMREALERLCGSDSGKCPGR